MKRVLVFFLMATVAVAAFATGTSEVATTETIREVSWHYPGGKQQEEAAVWGAINEKLVAREGITVDFQRSDWGAFNDRMNVMLASGEPMDIVFTSNWSNNFYERVSNGAYLPLNDLIKKHGPRLLTDLPESLFMAGEIDGEIYAVPNYQTIVTQHGMMTTQALADKYDLDVEHIRAGKDIIEQVSRIEPFLRQIKENEPDIIPFQPFFLFFGLWEQVTGTPCSLPWGHDDFQLLSKKEVNVIKERYDAIYREWLREGLIREDIATVQDDRADVDQLRYGVWRTAVKPGVEIEAEIKFGQPMVVVPLFEPYVGPRAGDGTMNAVTVNSQEPEAAVKVIELFNTDVELYNMLCFGIEDVHFKKVGPSRIEQIRDSAGNSAYYPNTAWMFGNQFNAYLLPAQPDDLWEVTDRMNRTAQVASLRGFMPDLEPVKNLIAQHSAADQEYWGSEWLYLDDEAKYEEIKKERYEKTMAAGFEEIRTEIQRQIDEWVEATGR